MLLRLVILSILIVVNSECPHKQVGLVPWSWNTEMGQVTIPAGQSVLISSSPPKLDYIIVQGTLIFDDKNISLDVNWIRVDNGGAVIMGSEETGCQITQKIIVTLWGDRVDKSVNPMGDDPADATAFGTKGFGFATGSTCELHGYVNGPSWTRLAETARNGSSTITVQEKIFWQPGDRIVIATTDYPTVKDYKLPESKNYTSISYYYARAFPEQTEERVIVAVSADGMTITLDEPLNYTHWGAGYERAEVGLLTRHIVIQGDPSSVQSEFGGHFMIRRVQSIHLRGVEFTRMGQLGILGRYPVHWHLMGSLIGLGFYARDLAIHHNFQRCFVIHASDGLLVKDNIGYDTRGHCFFLEDGGEVFNVLDHNLALISKPIAKEDPRQPIPTDITPANFWITNPNNTFINNAAVSGFFGFWFALPLRPMGLSVVLYPKDPTWERGRITPLLQFENNLAHSCHDNCLQIDQNVKADGTIDKGGWNPQRGPFNGSLDSGYPFVQPFIKGFTAYKSRSFGIWGKSNVRYTDVVLLDNKRGYMSNGGNTVLENALIVGETDNIGWPRAGHDRSYTDPWGSNSSTITGHETYDNGGPQYMRNVTFRNYVTTPFRKASAIGVLQNGPFMLDTENVYLDLKFENSNQLYLALRNGDAPWGWTVYDGDGSVTNVPGGAWLVNPNATHMIPEGENNCEFKENWNAFVCKPRKFGYVQIVYRNNNGYMPSSDGFGDVNPDRLPPGTKKTLAQWFEFGDDLNTDGSPVTGAEIDCSTSASKKCWQFMTNTLAGQSLTVRFYNGQSLVKIPQSSFIQLESVRPGDWIVFAYPMPKNAFPLNITTSSGVAYTRVYSMCDLTTNTYVYNAANEHLYFKFQSTRATKDFTRRFGYFTDYSGDAPNANIVALGCPDDGCPINNYEIPKDSSVFYPKVDDYKVVLSPCSSTTTKGAGNGFFELNTVKNKLRFAIYHDINLDANRIWLYDGNPTSGGKQILVRDFMTPSSPVHGIFTLTQVQRQKLYNEQLYVTIDSNVTSNHLCGQIKCVNPSGCTPAPALPQYDACNPVGLTRSVYSEGLVAPWVDGSWPTNTSDPQYTNITYNNTAMSLCGGKSLKVRIRRGALSFYIRSSANRTALDGYDFLEFFAKLETGFNETVLKIRLENGTAPILKPDTLITESMVSNYVISEETWSRVRVPLTSVGITSPGIPVGRIVIYLSDYNSDWREIYIDEIRFGTYSSESYGSGSDPNTILNDQLQSCQVDALQNDYAYDPNALEGWEIAVIAIVLIVVVAGGVGIGFFVYRKKNYDMP
eukprot:TRINITY_DN11443_c0_g1_i1.p1 TRINITY_DN11443_c0_g1~~TRINITY_DN11443_c0_g1_i1.p1  ORF type:complete len:1291 (-),score=304.46 TRINITY_DN11443_c0_g1_i1:59-3931(-)